MYIVFEGIEGCGKSLQLNLLSKFLIEKGKKFFLTKEPGSTDIGFEIRKILLNNEFKSMNKLTEMFLYLADRAEHYEKIILKNFFKYDYILSDRSFFSQIAYQGYGRGINIEVLFYLNKLIINDIFPDYVFLLDCDVEVGIKRALSREKNKITNIDESRFENEALDFHKKVRQGFLELSKKYNNWFIINANKSINEVQKDIQKIFLEKIL